MYLGVDVVRQRKEPFHEFLGTKTRESEKGTARA